jgi:hypothetical protein
MCLQDTTLSTNLNYFAEDRNRVYEYIIRGFIGPPVFEIDISPSICSISQSNKYIKYYIIQYVSFYTHNRHIFSGTFKGDLYLIIVMLKMLLKVLQWNPYLLCTEQNSEVNWSCHDFKVKYVVQFSNCSRRIRIRSPVTIFILIDYKLFVLFKIIYFF